MIGAFFAWWLGQLADLLPSWLRPSALTSEDALVIIPGEPLDGVNSVGVRLRRNGKEAALGEFALGAPELGDLPRSPSRPVVLQLNPADALEKTLSLPLAAQAELDQVLAFEMDRETPFTSEEVYWNHSIEALDRQHGRMSVRLVLMPKANLAPLLAALAQVRIVPRWVEIGDGSAARPYLPLDADRGRPLHRSRRPVMAAAVCCAILALGAIVTPFLRQAAVLAALDREIKVGQATAAQAEALRREIERLSRTTDLVKSELDKAGRPLELLARVTRLLPDDTYLTELGLRQHKLTLSGRSAGAARLIGALAADGTFQNPSFAAPVTRLDALRTEVFSVVAEVSPAP